MFLLCRRIKWILMYHAREYFRTSIEAFIYLLWIDAAAKLYIYVYVYVFVYFFSYFFYIHIQARPRRKWKGVCACVCLRVNEKKKGEKERKNIYIYKCIYSINANYEHIRIWLRKIDRFPISQLSLRFYGSWCVWRWNGVTSFWILVLL